MSDDIPDVCRKRRNPALRRLFGEREDLEQVCEETDGYCAGCHARIAGGGPF